MEPFYLCIAARLAVAWLVHRVDDRALPYLSAAIAAAGLGMLLQYNRRMVALESTAAGGAVWWNELRPLHGSMWLAAGLAGYVGNRRAWPVLLADLGVGVAAWSAFKGARWLGGGAARSRVCAAQA